MDRGSGRSFRRDKGGEKDSRSSAGRPPPSIRGTHNRPWQRESSNARNNVVADDDDYDFASMDVVMAPSPAAAAPAPAPVSAYDLYKQKSGQRLEGSANASFSRTASASPALSTSASADSKLSSYERYRQQRQNQQIMEKQQPVSRAAAPAIAPSRSFASSTAASTTARSPPSTRRVFSYDSSEGMKGGIKPPTSPPVSPYKASQEDDSEEEDRGRRRSSSSSRKSLSSSGRLSGKGDTEKMRISNQSGGANELKAALVSLKKKKERKSLSNATSYASSSAARRAASPRQLRKSRLTAANEKPVEPASSSKVEAQETARNVTSSAVTSTRSVPTIPRTRSRSPAAVVRVASKPTDTAMERLRKTGLSTADRGASIERHSYRSTGNSSLPPTGRRARSPSPGAHVSPTNASTTSAAQATKPLDANPPTSTPQRGWSTMSKQKVDVESKADNKISTASLQSQNSKVGQYLASRNTQRLVGVEPAKRSPVSSKKSVYTESPDNTPRSTPMTTPAVSDDDSPSGDSDSSLSSDGEDIFDEGVEGWSVRVCVVSAVDFPINVVPNIPLSPIIRVALVPLPESAGAESTKAVSDKDNMKRTLDSNGIASIRKSRMRCTASKITSKRDNGSVEFHEEMRWDHVQNPRRTALAVELSARAVMTPANIRESPYAQTVQPIQFPSTGSIGRGSSHDKAGLGSLFRRNRKQAGTSEMETAKAAAAVAKHLVEEGRKSFDDNDGEEATNSADMFPPSSPISKVTSGSNQSEMDVKLRHGKRRKKPKATEDIRLGSQIVPLTDLPLKKSLEGNETVRIEQWFQLETSHSLSTFSHDVASKSPKKRNPSILLEISLSSREALDESEDDMDEITEMEPGLELKASFSRRASMKIRSQLKKETKPVEAIPKEEEPVLQPGIVDYICVVGARDIGNQKSDDGSSGWVNTTPECGLLEQFPPSDEYLSRSGRNVSLPDKVEWFCFPEGCKLWRGTTPPNAEEMNLNRFSASSPVNIATTIASFDACLGCTTSFSWFVLASNSDEYGSESMKTYGACIRFFVPAPLGIDQTQDDFGQVIAPSDTGPIQSREVKKRLWAPVGICVTSSMPIIGALEVILLRMCEALSSPGRLLGSVEQPSLDKIYEDILNLVMNFHRPIPGVVQCSVPFLSGDPLKITLCPPTGLPSLPHGSAITSVCRLLGADGLVFLLTAMLTECKILLHSDDTSNISLVAEVATALLYPFSWSLPYIPVLPSAMTEVIEAPMPYIVGIPSCNFKSVDPLVLEDVVVVDLDKDLTGVDYFDDTHGGFKSKIPTPLPTSIASNVSKAVYRLLQADVNQSEPSIEASQLNGRTFPRMQGETNVEREFRIAVAMEVCGLVRGYQDCLVYASTTQPVFNVDKFLQNAPILYEEQRGATANASSRQILSPRSRRFVSILVNCQHFHQFLESEQHAEKRFFHHVMSELNAFGAKKDFLAVKRVLSLDAQKTIDLLRNTLQRLEDRTATYSVRRVEGVSLPISSSAESLFLQRFPIDILSPIQTASEANSSGTSDVDGVNHISLEYLVELEKNPWRHQQLFAVESATVEAFSSVALKVKIRDAIGERRYHNWKNAMERTDVDDASLFPDDGSASSAAVDLGSLLAYNSDETSVTTDTSVSEEPASNDSKRRIADAKDRDIIRRCLERANVSGPSGVQSKSDSLLDLTTGAESALRNPSARRFLLSVLTKLSDAQKDASQESARQKKRSSATGPSKLEEGSFETLVRLGCAMLDACMEDWDYNSAYSLLKLTAGLYCTVGDGESASIAYMTQKMGNHPIYADLGVWEKAKEVHLAASRKDTSKQSSDDENEGDDDNDEYEAAVATLYEMLGYGIPAEELARFASRVSENSGWFRSERGQSLLLLARRICMRRDQGEASSASQTSDLEMMSPTASRSARASVDTTDQHETDSANDWLEIGWVHPAAQSSRRMMADKTKRMGAPVQQVQVDDRLQKSGSDSYMKRSAITTMAYLGSSVIVTGGLDGGVFLARRVKRGPGERDEDGADPSEVRGVHLDWGSSGSRYAVGSSAASLDGEYGVGAVSCLAATKATNQSYQSLMFSRQSSRKDTVDDLDDEEVLQAMEGARVVAGTTCGDLRVWSVKDVLSAVFYANHGGDFGSAADSRTSRPDGSSSSFLSKRKSGTDYAAGSSLTRLKFSLRGRALSGHRGGVSCIDVPSHVYRPDSIISGGADGLIKLWSLRTSAAGRRNELDQGSMLAAASKGSTESMTSRAKSSRSGDALSILSGHGGRILCIKTAWHGDRLLSGGADRTVRVWDLAGSGGKCLHSLSGHLGWVTSVQYWGPNTIISASTDRSIALWDARVRNSPLFALRHHNAPISSVLVGTRTDPIMASAASDGTIAAWDFRRLSDAESGSPKLCKVVRSPAAKLYLHDFASRRKVCGPVVLSRGPNAEKRTILCAGRDAVVREWDVRSGDVVAEHATGHCDTISTFSTFQGESLTDTQLETTGSEGIGGTITTSWDGTVRVRRQVRK